MSVDSNTSDLINILTKSMDQVSKCSNNSDINAIIRRLLIDFTNSEFATYLLYDKEEQLLYTDKSDKNIQIDMSDAKGLLGNAFLAKKSSVYNHIASEKYYIPEIDNPSNSRIKAQMIIPITSDDNLIGIVRVSRTVRYPKNYTKHDMELIQSLSSFLIKVSNILSSNGKNHYELTADDSKINEEIIKIEEKHNEPKNCDELMLFFSNTVHDIRTPANTLYGFLELIEDKVEDKRLKSFIGNAKESAIFINDMTSSLLERAKDEHQSVGSSLKEVSSIKFFAQIADGFSANMFNKDIEYLIYIDPSIPKKISIEALKLKRVIMNLIGNAYKFTPKDKQIHLSVTYANSKIKISIKDQGIGIDESRQKAIFEAFKQAEDDTSDKFGGTGLGLSISAQYVNDLGGKLLLDSAIDKGSEFYFEIPIEIVDAEVSQKPFKVRQKIITLLTDKKDSADAVMIVKYLTTLGIAKENIIISSTFCVDTTHLICFQHKFDEGILDIAKDKNIEIIIVEESLFALEGIEIFKDITVISQNSYYGDVIHHTVLTEKIIKALVVDDNSINIHLIQAILEDEYCETSAASSGEEALNKFREAYISGNSFDMIFLDKHLPGLSGTDVIKSIRAIEGNQNSHIYAISITGDPHQTDAEKDLFDLLVTKPFKTSEMKEAFHKAVLKQRGA
ncbi:MAG: ATP-binding protein [Campylobacterota bacterium]|nr:ATP-binding protein [Campylobacterota bacterium]